MAKLDWDKNGERFYETGVSHGVLYVNDGTKPSGITPTDTNYSKGVVWNGLSSVSESSEGGEPNAIYADDIKYLNILSAEDIKATIEAYTYPDEFAACEGRATMGGLIIAQQSRKTFGFCYRTKVGNDENGDNYDYKLHILYNCLAAPSERSYQTINDSPEAITFSWEISTTPETVHYNSDQYKPTALLTIDSRKFKEDEAGKDPVPAGSRKEGLDALLDALYGTTNTEPYLPTPDKVIALLSKDKHT